MKLVPLYLYRAHRSYNRPYYVMVETIPVIESAKTFTFGNGHCVIKKSSEKTHEKMDIKFLTYRNDEICYSAFDAVALFQTRLYDKAIQTNDLIADCERKLCELQ
jgi:hypothetical protein